MILTIENKDHVDGTVLVVGRGHWGKAPLLGNKAPKGKENEVNGIEDNVNDVFEKLNSKNWSS